MVAGSAHRCTLRALHVRVLLGLMASSVCFASCGCAGTHGAGRVFRGLRVSAHQCFMSACTLGSLNLRPIRRLASCTVLRGFSAACRAAHAR